ncbi:MAG: molybdopterin-dependent oxidoreductase, partial [Myxococcota bacterium]
SGNLGVRGGGASYYFARRAAFDTDFGFEVPESPRTLAETLLGQEILNATEPPIKVTWVTAGNPVAMLPDSLTVRRALKKTFTIVVDTHPTDTTDVADIVLPTLTLLEDEDLLGAYGNHYLRASRPAIKPPPGPRHELEIWQEIATRVGLADLMKGSLQDWKRRATQRLEQAGIPLERIEKGPVRSPFASEILFEKKRFATSSHKAQLLNRPPVPAPVTTADFPLTLLAVSTPDSQSSQWTTERPDGPAEVFVHPSSAAGIADGVQARLVSAIGEMPVTVRHDNQQRPDVAHMAKGGQLRDGRCANVLVQAVETDHGGGAAYYDQGVRLEASLQ